MTEILQQLDLNSTFFIQLAVFFILFAFLSQVFFKPFLRLIEERHRRTVEDRDAAEKMMASAEAKMQEYQARLHAARVEARAEMEGVVAAARAEESKILGAARDEAKKIAQQAATELDSERARIRVQLEMDVEALATAISDKLLVKKG